jgi:hypothetical protein
MALGGVVILSGAKDPRAKRLIESAPLGVQHRFRFGPDRHPFIPVIKQVGTVVGLVPRTALALLRDTNRASRIG